MQQPCGLLRRTVATVVLSIECMLCSLFSRLSPVFRTAAIRAPHLSSARLATFFHLGRSAGAHGDSSSSSGRNRRPGRCPLEQRKAAPPYCASDKNSDDRATVSAASPAPRSPRTRSSSKRNGNTCPRRPPPPLPPPPAAGAAVAASRQQPLKTPWRLSCGHGWEGSGLGGGRAAQIGRSARRLNVPAAEAVAAASGGAHFTTVRSCFLWSGQADCCVILCVRCRLPGGDTVGENACSARDCRIGSGAQRWKTRMFGSFCV